MRVVSCEPRATDGGTPSLDGLVVAHGLQTMHLESESP
jgi:hypothetical protein